MNELERFEATVNFEKPDYWPLVTVGGLGYIHEGGLLKLHNEGLPKSVTDIESWCKYWGTCVFDSANSLAEGAPGIKQETWTEGDFEFVRSETGALTRQVVDNDIIYSMPEFMEFNVRDRQSWQRYRELTAPRRKASEKLEEMRLRFTDRTRPLSVYAGGTWGTIRNLMGPEKALLAVYDDPDLIKEILATFTRDFDEYTVPVIEALRPEIINMWEDFCYNHGMLISPETFRGLCAPYYRHVAEVAHDCGVELLIVDSDGKVDEYCLLLEEVGFNGCWPMEQVCGNDLLDYRRKQPKFIFAGGIEKEIVNTGGVGRIETELVPKIPDMLKTGGFFPMFDHAIQTQAGFQEMCICMTRLHEICGSQLGDFSRRRE